MKKTNLIKIFASGSFAFGTYFVFNTFVPEFTHGYITFVFPLGACGIVYAVSLLCTGVLKKLLKRDKEGAN